MIIVPISINYNNEFSFKENFYYDRFSNNIYNLRNDCLNLVINVFQRIYMAKQLFKKIYDKKFSCLNSSLNNSKLLEMTFPFILNDDKQNLINIVKELKNNVILKIPLSNVFENGLSFEVCKSKL